MVRGSHKKAAPDTKRRRSRPNLSSGALLQAKLLLLRAGAIVCLLTSSRRLPVANGAFSLPQSGCGRSPPPCLVSGATARYQGPQQQGCVEKKLMLQLLLTVAAIVWATSSVFANDEQDCFQGQEPQLRIKGCSEMIERVPEDATAYHNRAFAYALAGDIDNAIEDYSKVIALAPSNASAYANRGRAYASKGDYGRAVEDETKAHELMAKATAQAPVVAPKPAKAVKKAAAATKPATVAPKAKEIPRATPIQEPPPAPATSWWSWLWGNSPDQDGSKNAKP
jgi:tetratricopeptide (TPR) repeat protein